MSKIDGDTSLTAAGGNNASAVGAVSSITNGALVKYHHVLGVRMTTGRTIEHLSDDTVMYLSGRHVAAFHVENPQHRFIVKNQRTEEIITFCVSANRKYIALAERMMDATMQVNIYTQQTGSKVRSLEFKYLSKLPVVTMCFSTDNKHLVTVTALPDVYIYLWQVDKSRLVGMIDVPFEISRITISPWSYGDLCSTGPSTLKLWRLVDKQLKVTDVLPKRRPGDLGGPGGAVQSYRFSGHCWYDDARLVAGTEDGDLFVVENNETKKIIRAVLGEGIGVSAVTPTSRGILCGGDNGIVALLERSFDDGAYFRTVCRFTLSCIARVIDLSVSPKEDTAVAVTRDNNICLISMESLELVKGDLQVGAGGGDSHTTISGGMPSALGGGSILGGLTSVSTALSIGFHSDAVTALDVCVQKSILVTGSLDKTIRVWNFLRRRVEFTKKFDEEVLSLAVHPTGLRMVVGFKSYLRLYNMLVSDLHFCTELPVKGCNEVRYSRGGHCFAAVVAFRVLIYNAYDFLMTHQLTAHTVPIRSLCWAMNDLTLTTADVNGVVHYWNADGTRKDDADDARRNVSYTCVKNDDTTGMAAAIGAVRIAEAGAAEGEIILRCLVPGQEPRTVRPGWTRSVASSQRKHHTCELALSTQAQTLFVGTPLGSIALYRWPLLDDAQPYQVIEAHNGEVTLMTLSVDERFLFTVGDDGSCFMFEVDAIVEGRSVARKPFNFAAFEDVCYVLQTDIDDRSREIQALRQQIEELAVAKQREEQNIVAKYEIERAAKEEDVTSRMDFLKRQLDQAQKARVDAENMLQDNARQLEAMHMKAAEELESLYAKRSEEANARYTSLKTERDDLVVRYESKIFLMSKDHDAERRRVETKAKDTESKLSNDIGSLQKQIREQSRVSDAIIDQTIADYEMTIDEVSAKLKSELAKTEEDLGRAINSSSTGERDAERLRKEKGALVQQLNEQKRRIQELEQIVDRKNKENDSLKKEMGVRFESISTAEKKIQQLKKQTTELDKLRYVLTFKFNELKKEVAPKDRQIELMSGRVEEMDHELERVAVDRESLRQTVDRREQKLSTLQREVGNHRMHLEDKERVIVNLLHDLGNVISENDERRMVFQLKDIITRYASKHRGAQGAATDEDRTAEFERQREYMETQLNCLKRQSKQKESNMRQEAQRGTVENALLVKEINELRHEKKQLLTKCALVESQLREARVALHRATAATTSAPDGGSPGGSVPAERAGSVPPLASRSPVENEFAATAPASRGGAQVGRLIRGPTRSLRDIGQLDAEKIARIIHQVERNNEEMQRQQSEIERLRDFLAHLLSRADTATGGEAAAMTAEERKRHEEIRQHLVASGTPVPAAAASTPAPPTASIPRLPAAGAPAAALRPPSSGGRASVGLAKR